MSGGEETVRLRHMLDHAREAVSLVKGKMRDDLDSDRLLNLALVRLVEIVGEAAARFPARDGPCTQRFPGRHPPGAALRASVPLALPVPDRNHREFEPFCLVNRHHLYGFRSDRVRRIELDGTPDPLAHPRADGIVIQPIIGGDLLEDEAQLAETREPLRAVRHERDVAGEGRAVEQVARRGARPAIEAPAAQLAHELAGLAAAHCALVLRLCALPQKIRQVHDEERRPQKRRLGHAVVTVGQCAQCEQELAVERVLQEELASARCVRDVPSASNHGNRSPHVETARMATSP